MMAERGIDVSYETVRRWIDKFGLTDTKRIKQAKSSLAFRRSFCEDWWKASLSLANR